MRGGLSKTSGRAWPQAQGAALGVHRNAWRRKTKASFGHKVPQSRKHQIPTPARTNVALGGSQRKEKRPISAEQTGQDKAVDREPLPRSAENQHTSPIGQRTLEKLTTTCRITNSGGFTSQICSDANINAGPQVPARASPPAKLPQPLQRRNPHRLRRPQPKRPGGVSIEVRTFMHGSTPMAASARTPRTNACAKGPAGCTDAQPADLSLRYSTPAAWRPQERPNVMAVPWEVATTG